DVVRPAVDGPDVVLRIDANGLCEQESIDSSADLAEIFSGGIEYEQTRSAVSEKAGRAHRDALSAGAGVDEDVSLGISRHTGGFSHMNICGQLEEIDVAVEGNLRDLGRQQAAAEQRNRNTLESFHQSLLFLSVRVQHQFLSTPQLDFGYEEH